MAEDKKFDVSAGERKNLRRLMLEVERVAGDLSEMFKADLQTAVSDEYLSFAHMIADGKPVTDKKLIALSEAATAAWKFFYKMDELLGNAEVKDDGQTIILEPVALDLKTPEGQTFDVTYNVKYKVPVVVPLGESLVDALRTGFSCPVIPFGQKQVGFKVEQVELNGMVVPTPL